jgi:hypothetical protein
MAGTNLSSNEYNFINCFEITSTGTIVWQKKYRATSANMYGPYKLEQHTNGYIVSTVYANSSTSDSSWKISMLKIDGAGNPVWSGQYNDPTKLIVQYSSMATNDAGHILAAAEYGSTNKYMYYMLDSMGNVVWGKTSSGVSGATTYGPAGSMGIYGDRFLLAGTGSVTVPAAMIDNAGNGMCVSSAFTVTRSAQPLTAYSLGIAVADSPITVMTIPSFVTSTLTFHDSTYCYTASTAEPEVPALSQSAKVYPNPATGILHIVPGSEWREIKLISIDGRTVTAEITSTNADVQMNVSNVPAGVYYITITYASGERQVIKAMIGN